MPLYLHSGTLQLRSIIILQVSLSLSSLRAIECTVTSIRRQLPSLIVQECFLGYNYTTNDSSGWTSINIEARREGTILIPECTKRQRMADSQADSEPYQNAFQNHKDLALRYCAAPPPALPSQHSIPNTVMASQRAECLTVVENSIVRPKGGEELLGRPCRCRKPIQVVSTIHKALHSG
jgi:hypothetical protein